jgi:NitT/TauT family transport system permease protein
MRKAVPPFVIAVVSLIAWQILHAMAGSNTISAPLQTIAFLTDIMATTRFWLDVSETGQAFLWALLISMALGTSLGVALGLSRGTGEVIEPILVTFYALPKVTLYPLVLLVFGLGLSAKVAFGVMHGLVPITLLTRGAITQLKPVYWRTAQVLRLNRRDAIRLVVLPAIVPELIAGIRISVSLSLLGVLIGEMFASKRGLGFAAVNAMGRGDIRMILAIGLFLSVFAITANAALLALEAGVRHRTAAR